MNLIENKPLYTHSVSGGETTFLACYNGKDFYYRYNGLCHIIDVRHSSVPSDCVSWTIVNSKGLMIANNVMYEQIPYFVRRKAYQLVQQKTLFNGR